MTHGRVNRVTVRRPWTDWVLMTECGLTKLECGPTELECLTDRVWTDQVPNVD
jgi:hypothetical protein